MNIGTSPETRIPHSMTTPVGSPTCARMPRWCRRSFWWDTLTCSSAIVGTGAPFTRAADTWLAHASSHCSTMAPRTRWSAVGAVAADTSTLRNSWR
jgi:hypothetical protein